MTNDWMRPALEALIDHVDEATGRRALTDQATFSSVRGRLEHGLPGSIPDGERGDNLIMALLALRLKFSPVEARAKLETNLAMRAAGGRHVGAEREPARGSPTADTWADAEGSPAGSTARTSPDGERTNGAPA